MKQLNEVARMQQLAGITEIKVNNPNHVDPQDWHRFNYLFSTSNLPTSQREKYYDILRKYDADWRNFKNFHKDEQKFILNIISNYAKSLGLDLDKSLEFIEHGDDEIDDETYGDEFFDN